MIYASQHLLLYEILEIKNIRTYDDFPQDIKDKIPLSYDEWLNTIKPIKKSVVFKAN